MQVVLLYVMNYVILIVVGRKNERHGLKLVIKKDWYTHYSCVAKFIEEYDIQYYFLRVIIKIFKYL